MANEISFSRVRVIEDVSTIEDEPTLCATLDRVAYESCLTTKDDKNFYISGEVIDSRPFRLKLASDGPFGIISIVSMLISTRVSISVRLGTKVDVASVKEQSAPVTAPGMVDCAIHLFPITADFGGYFGDEAGGVGAFLIVKVAMMIGKVAVVVATTVDP